MIAWRPIGMLVLVMVSMAVLVVFAGSVTGSVGELWEEIRTAVYVLLGVVALFSVMAVWMVVMRVRGRNFRDIGRYQLILSQADEATRDELAAATDALVQTVRATLFSRVCSGQPWVAFEMWHDPPAAPGETGRSVLFLLCEEQAREGVLAALRRVSPNLTVRHDRDEGAPVKFPPPAFEPMHVMRVKKARGWELPIASQRGSADGSNARSVMASIIRQQQDIGNEGFVSCVRVCVMPTDDSVDQRAATRLRRMAQRETNANAAISADILEAQQGGGGALAFVEFQAAVQHKGSDADRDLSYSALQTVCKRLLAPGMSHRSVNTLVERNVILRQRLYQRRWARATPPLIPDQSGATLMFPNDLAVLIELPTLAAEHDLPLGRNTIPYLPAPVALTRGRMDIPEVPPEDDGDTLSQTGFRTRARSDEDLHEATLDGDEEVEVVHGEVVDETGRRRRAWSRARAR